MGPGTNPLLDEINGLSLGAKAALMAAHGASTAPPASPEPLSGGLMPPNPAIAAARQQMQPDAGPPPAMLLPPDKMPTVPSLGAPHPAVKAPLGTVTGDENERSRLMATGSGISQIKNPWLRGLATAGNIAGSVASPLVPGLMRQVPGTEEHHNMLLNRANQAVTQDEASAENRAKLAAAQAEIPFTQAKTRAAELIEITPQMAEELGSPALTGNSVTQGALQHMMTTAGTNRSHETVAGMNNATKEDIASAQTLSREKIAALKPEQRDDRAIRLMQKPPDTRTPEENAYLGAYARWVDQTKTQPGIARAAAYGQFRPVQVLGTDGEVHYDFSGHAIGTGASSPQSMNFKTAVGMAKFMTSGKGGTTLTNYRTANDHLDLLKQAVTALDNGDVQALNQMNNAFKQQFGSPAPTNVDAVRTMLAGELANVAKVTGATDQEIRQQAENLNRASSPEQFAGFIQTNQELMDQKALEMYQQYESGLQGRAVFGKGVKAANPEQPKGAVLGETTKPDGVYEKPDGTKYRVLGGKVYAH